MVKIDGLGKHTLGNWSAFSVKTRIWFISATNMKKWQQLKGWNLWRRRSCVSSAWKGTTMLINVAQRINALVQVVHYIIILHYMTTSRKKLMTLTRRTQRYGYPRLQNIKQCSLQIVPVKVKSKDGKFISTYVLLDSGSESTLIREDVLKRLDLEG